MTAISDKGLDFIKKHEGCVLKAYRDIAGVLTIGYGHTNRAGGFQFGPNTKITQKQANDILRDDINRNFGPRVNRHLPNALQHVFDGSVSFDFNTGAIHKASWVGAFKAGKNREARQRFMQWNKARVNGVLRPVAGLTKRRNAEADMIFQGKYNGKQTVNNDKGIKSDYEQKILKLGYKTVEAFQQAHPKLTVDGIIGPATRAAVDREIEAKGVKNKTIGGGIAGLIAAVSTYTSEYFHYVLIVVILAVFGYFAWKIISKRFDDELFKRT